MREASFNFKSVLHNGQEIIGTGQKTTIVPKGKGPFSTWEEAAVDAIHSELSDLRGVNKVAEILYTVERYNGLGYVSGAGKNETSPYLWAQTNVNDGKGMYTSDGKFDENASSVKSIGFCAVMKYLEQEKEIEISYQGKKEDKGESKMIYPKFGDKSDKVTAVQRALKANGFEIMVDGDFGPQTKKALGAFQVKQDLNATGVVDKETYTALFPSYSVEELADKIVEKNPGINPVMVYKALSFYGSPSVLKKDVITLVDYTKHSATPRLYQIDMSSFESQGYLVSHGLFSDKDDDGFVDETSNDPTKHMNSHGAAVTHKIVSSPRYGQSLQLKGLEEQNSNILERGLVVHSGLYVSDMFIAKYGKVGRTLGTWALNPKVYEQVIKEAGIGSLWYSYFDSEEEGTRGIDQSEESSDQGVIIQGQVAIDDERGIVLAEEPDREEDLNRENGEASLDDGTT